MSELTTSTALGRITRIDGDFIMLESGFAFWLPSDLQGTQGIQLGDMVALTYDRQDMKVTSIKKED